jgi:exosortase A
LPTQTLIVSKGSPAVWRESVLVLALGIASILVLFQTTAATAVNLWAHSSAYNYGYLIAPIAAYVAWHDRHRVSHLAPRPSWWGLAIAVPAAALWLASDLIGIDEGRHFALVGMFQALFLGVLGLQVYRQMLFPCLYLFLMVPSGEALLTPLQKLSHAGTVVLLHASRIPTYAEGMSIEVPHGSFLVEPGCAGLNFFLASLALALLFGKLTYRTFSARILCVVVALLTSVIANIVRIYLIIAITEWSHRRIAIADDHLLYGWGFFALIMLGMMWLGAQFEHRTPPEPVVDGTPAHPVPPRWGWAVASALAIIGISATPVALAALTSGSTTEEPMHVALPNAFPLWTPDTAATWRPGFVLGDSDAMTSYNVNGHRVDVVVIAYRAQRDGREAAAAGNTPADGKMWEEIERHAVPTEVGDRPAHGIQAIIRSGERNRMVLAWYVSADCLTASRLVSKLCAARERLQGRTAPGAYFAMSTDITESRETARRVLNDVAAALDVRIVMAADTRQSSRQLAAGER